MHPLDIPVISPHLNNAEISVGGTIAVSLRQNLHVGVPEWPLRNSGIIPQAVRVFFDRRL